MLGFVFIVNQNTKKRAAITFGGAFVTENNPPKFYQTNLARLSSNALIFVSASAFFLRSISIT
jgi:hypothetical protein